MSKVMVFWNRRYRREYVDTVRQSLCVRKVAA